MKKTKVWYMGKRLKDIYPHATKWQVFKYRVRKFLLNCLKLVIWAGIIFGIFTAGRYLYPAKVYTTQEIIKEVPIQAQVLERIAKCESPTGHWKDGQVAMNSNTNRSVDIGKYQINNQAWGKKATELGYNLVVEEDNEAMANWIYTNRGTEDWYSSKKCWQK